MANSTAKSVHIVLLLVQLFFLASPHFTGRNQILIFCIITLAAASHVLGPVSDDPADAQPYTLLWSMWLATIEKCVTAIQSNGRIEDHYWRKDRKPREASIMNSFGLQKLKWAAALMFNSRLVRWNLQVKNVPVTPTQTRGRFLTVEILRLAKLILVTDLLLQLGIRLYWTAPGGARFESSKDLTIGHPEMLWSFVKVVVFACGPYFFMSMNYVAGSIVAVALGLSTPADWPPLFGDIGDATTVRNFWGTFWHQSMRRPFTTFNHLVIDLFHIPRSTTLAFHVQIWTAFVISGFMHGQAMATLPRPHNITTSDATVGIANFFLWQALAISIEDIVQSLFQQMGFEVVQLGRVRFVLGYMWVTWSMWFSLPWAADVMLRLRLTEKSFLSFTVFGPVVGYLPIPKA